MRYLFEDFALDVDKRELLRAAAAVSISPQALDLLIYLIRHRERVIRKDDLISAIWGDRIITDAALATRLNSARVAIGDSGKEQRLIKTLQRKGFRFVGSVEEVASPGDAQPRAARFNRWKSPTSPRSRCFHSKTCQAIRSRNISATGWLTTSSLRSRGSGRCS